MTKSKTYLNVPYAQKDAAKALGARWDAASKKWYVPAGVDIMLFSQWRLQSLSLDEKLPASGKNSVGGVTTQASDKNFVAYDGEEPPWN